MKKNITAQRLIGLLIAFIIGLSSLSLIAGLQKNNADANAAPSYQSVLSESALGGGTTYYVSSSTGNDSYSGTSPDLPWKTLSKVSATTFSAGQNILFKKGDVWDGLLFPQGSGSAGNPITVSSYGDGNGYPILNHTATKGTGDGVYNPTVLLRNQSYWIIENLEITNTAKTGNNLGILLLTAPDSAVKHYGIEIRYCYVHDVTAGSTYKLTGGILAHGAAHNEDGTRTKMTSNPAISSIGWDGVYIHHNHVKDVSIEGIRSSGANTSFTSNETQQYYRCRSVHKNIVISDNFIEEVWGDGIVLSEVGEGGLVERNIVKNSCKTYEASKNYAGCWAWYCVGAIFRYNEVYGIKEGYNDGEAFDFDTGCQSSLMEYNYSHDNGGGLLLNMPGAAAQTGANVNIFRYNISYNDGFGTGQTATQGLFHLSLGNTLVHNNTIYVGRDTYLVDNNNVSDTAYTAGTLKNNIIYIANGATLKLKDGASKNTVNYNGSANNIIYKGGTINQNSNSSTPTGTDTDPKMINPSDASSVGLTYENMGKTEAEYLALFRERIKGFRVADDSPAKYAGTTSGISSNCNFDIFGNPVTTRSIGAHEFNTACHNAYDSLSASANTNPLYPNNAYTEASQNNYQSALSSAQAYLAADPLSDHSLLSQTALASAKQALDNARDSLALTDEYAELLSLRAALLAALNSLPNLNSALYTSDSWWAYQNVISAARTISTDQNASATQLKNAASSLSSASALLITLENYNAREALGARISALSSINSAEYTETSYAAFYLLISTATDVYQSPDSSTERLKSELSLLENAESVLVRVNIAARAELLSVINEMKTLDPRYYTSASWAAFQDVLAAAIDVYDNVGAAIAVIEETKDTLSAAKQNVLIRNNTKAREELSTLIDLASTLNADDYTPDSYNALSQAIRSAQEIYDAEESTVEEVEAAVSALEYAISLLVDKALNEYSAAKNELLALLEEANSLAASDYTSSTWGTMASYRIYAQSVYNDSSSSVAALISASQYLKSSLDALSLNEYHNARSALLQALEDSYKLNSDYYTPLSFEAFFKIRSDAQSVYDEHYAVNGRESQAVSAAALRSARAALSNAAAALVTVTHENLILLNNAIAALPSLNLSLYTEKTRSLYQTIKDNAIAVAAKPYPSNQEILQAISNVESAPYLLKTIVFDQAESALLAALSVSLDKSYYTDGSFDAYLNAKDDAQAIYDLHHDPIPYYTEQAEAAKALRLCLDNLNYAKGKLVTIAYANAYNDLKTALDELPDYLEGLFTTVSYKSYVSALDAAKYALVNPVATADDLAYVLTNLKKAESKLEYVLTPSEKLPPVVSDLTLNYKKSSTLSVILDEGAEVAEYIVGDSKIVSVDKNGTVTALKRGKTTITVVDSFGNQTVCNVEVEFSFWQWLLYTVCFGWIWM